MVKRFGFIALAGLVALWPVALAKAEHDHDHHHDRDHHDHHDDHGSGFGIHFGSGGVGVHYEDDHHDGHHGHDDHWDHGHHSSRHHNGRHHHSDWHHSDWHFVVPHYDHHYHGTYYHDSGINYYVPRTYVTDGGSYVAAKPAAMEFGGYAHVDDLAGRLERQANQLCLELHYNYQHNRDYAKTYGEAYQVLEMAKYIHAKEHQGDRAEVAQRLETVDQMFHHVQDDVRSWSRRQKRQIGQGGAQTKLQSLEATLHHLMYDVGVKGTHGAPNAMPAPVVMEVAPPPGN